ncbi:MAG: flagellin lysine-N-methylase [Lachnospiraceae bacterium]
MVRVISYYEEFECLASDCPYTCCKGWRVQLDDETVMKYQKAKGPEGIKLSLLIQKNPAVGPVLRQICGKCPQLTKVKLCRFQVQGKEDHMPLICRLYPRVSIRFGDIQEITMELSCPESARLFLKNQGRLSFHEVDAEKKVPVFYTLENEDEDFLQFLLEDREAILDYLWNGSENDYHHLNLKMQQIHFYVLEEYGYILKQDYESARKITLSGKDDGSLKTALSGKGYAFYPIKMLNEFFYRWFDNPRRMKENPMMKKYVSDYRKIFGTLYEYEADFFFEKNMKKMLAEFPEYEMLFCSYYSYILQQEYVKAYEDYYMIQSTLLAPFYTEFLMIIFLVEYLGNRQQSPNEPLSREVQAKILMVVEKALRHNYSLEEIILKKIREYGKETLFIQKDK